MKLEIAANLLQSGDHITVENHVNSLVRQVELVNHPDCVRVLVRDTNGSTGWLTFGATDTVERVAR